MEKLVPVLDAKGVFFNCCISVFSFDIEINICISGLMFWFTGKQSSVFHSFVFNCYSFKQADQSFFSFFYFNKKFHLLLLSYISR